MLAVQMKPGELSHNPKYSHRDIEAGEDMARPHMLCEREFRRGACLRDSIFGSGISKGNLLGLRLATAYLLGVHIRLRIALSNLLH